MAITQGANVLVLGADNDAVTTPIFICGIRYIAGSGSPSAALKVDDSSGETIWQPLANATSEESNVEINCPTGVHADMAGTGTTIFLYLK